jgi:hypothetical protein
MKYSIGIFDLNTSFMGFYFFEIVYTRFHSDETRFLSFFIYSLYVIKNSMWQLIY